MFSQVALYAFLTRFSTAARNVLANTSKFGSLANLALIAGAAMSFTDLAFDLVMIREYLNYKEGK